MKTKLSRSQTDKILGGVCAGLGDYLNIDPVFVRLFFILLTVMDGIGFWIYILLWLLMPESQADDSKFEMNQFGERARKMGGEFSEAVSRPNPDVKKYLGVGLVLMGLFFLFEEIVQQFNLGWFAWFNRGIFWALLLVAAGMILLVRAIKER
ncbi:MAG: PspC domain-containing protein [Anaerolineaceae bacterium]|jgi:phage shock protein PspC (stress-responsive transcriptional regulator)|nr:PspC domain-containing protein [Anaerolineaceae bacterium]